MTDKTMTRFFMSIPDAVNLVFLATSMMLGEEIFSLKMPERNIYELAQETIKTYGKGKNIKIKITGTREREKMHERLFTDEEKELMIEKRKFCIILPDEILKKKRKSVYREI